MTHVELREDNMNTSLDAQKDVGQLVHHYEFSSLHGLVRTVFAGEILTHDIDIKESNETFSRYWMGGTDFYVPHYYSDAASRHAVLKEIACVINKDATDEYIQAFSTYISKHLYEDTNSAVVEDSYFISTWKNDLGENLYQPTLLNGLRLYGKSYLFTHYKGLKNWHHPQDRLCDHFDPSYASEEDLSYLSNNQDTVEQLLQPELFSSKRKAVKIARKSQKAYEQLITKAKRKVVREVNIASCS